MGVDVLNLSPQPSKLYCATLRRGRPVFQRLIYTLTLYLLTPFVVFAVTLAASASRIPSQDWGPLAMLAGLPALGLVVGHPWSRLTLSGSAPGGR